MISISIVANKSNQVNTKIKKNHVFDVFWDGVKKHQKYDFFVKLLTNSIKYSIIYLT